MQSDKIIIQGMTYECRIGFHEYEQDILQRLTLDVEAEVEPVPPSESDRIESLRMDYFEANKVISQTLSGKRFNLIETVGEDIARILLKTFAIREVRISVSKFPHDMPNVRCVTYVCTRSRAL